MSRPVLIALDSGTSVVKAVAFTADGAILAARSRPNAYAILPGGGAEQDMRRSWDDACAVLRDIAETLATQQPDAELAALAITGQGDGTWLIDAEGEPVGDGWLWLDARAAAIVEELKASGAATAAFAITGTGLAACQQGPQLLWMQRHRPEALARAATAMHPKDYLYFRATGLRRTSPCEGCFSFGDFRTRCYRDEVLHALGLAAQRRLLPPMQDGTLGAAPLTEAAARQTGLPSGLPVVLCYLDVLCTALGAGLYGTGDDVGVSIVGSTGMHMRLVPDVADVAPSPAMTGYCMPFPVPGHTIQSQTNMAATLNIDWLADIVADAAALVGGSAAREDILARLGEMALRGRAGAALFHPFISSAGERGPFTDVDRAGVLHRAGYACPPAGTCAGGVRGSGSGGARLLRRDRRCAGRYPRHRRRRTLAGDPPHPRRLPRSSGARHVAAGGWRRGGRDDRRGLRRPASRHGVLRAHLRDAATGAADRAGGGACRALRCALSDLSRRLCRASVGVATPARGAGDARCPLTARGARSPSSATTSCCRRCSRRRSAPPAATGSRLRTMRLPWPDAPMEHGYARPGFAGLKEYQGDPDAIVRFVADAQVLVTQLAPLSAGMLEQLPALRLVAVSRGGPVNIDMAAARARGVRVVNTPGRNASAVAEFTIGAILAETRLIRAGHESLRAGEWRGDFYRADRTGRELSELTVGVVGYGQIGTRVVRLLKAFGCRILVADPYVQLSGADRADGVAHVHLDALLAQSDVVTLHARVTEETTGFIGGAQFAAMRKGAFFVNTARGPMVDYDALYDALASGHLGGAMLETFAIEPVPPDWPLLRLPNVTLTPHIAGASVKTVTIAAAAAAEEVRRYVAGEPPLNPC